MTNVKKAFLLAVGGLGFAILPPFLPGEIGTVLGGAALMLAIIMEVLAVQLLMRHKSDD